jgi:hypothetical protein
MTPPSTTVNSAATERRKIAAAGEGGADRKTLRTDMPFRFIAIEMDEAALFQRRQQARTVDVDRPVRTAVAQTVALVVLSNVSMIESPRSTDWTPSL